MLEAAVNRNKVLIVDDEADFVDLVQKHLESSGFDVTVAYSGDDGLKSIREIHPDIVILDVMMPDSDGYDVCAEIKQDEYLRDIPVIMLTAVASRVPSTRYSHQDAMTMEAEDYIAKPASGKQIEQAIRRLLDES